MTSPIFARLCTGMDGYAKMWSFMLGHEAVVYLRPGTHLTRNNSTAWLSNLVVFPAHGPSTSLQLAQTLYCPLAS